MGLPWFFPIGKLMAFPLLRRLGTIAARLSLENQLSLNLLCVLSANVLWASCCAHDQSTYLCAVGATTALFPLHSDGLMNHQARPVLNTKPCTQSPLHLSLPSLQSSSLSPTVVVPPSSFPPSVCLPACPAVSCHPLLSERKCCSIRARDPLLARSARAPGQLGIRRAWYRAPREKTQVK